MQVTRTAPRQNGWLTDAIKTARSFLPGGPPTVNITTAAPQQSPPWVMPAILVGGGVIALALFSRKKR